MSNNAGYDTLAGRTPDQHPNRKGQIMHDSREKTQRDEKKRQKRERKLAEKKERDGRQSGKWRRLFYIDETT